MNQSASLGAGQCRSPDGRESGAALLLVLLVLSLLMVVVLETTRVMEVDLFSAYYLRNSVQAQAIAESGVQVAEALLCRDALKSDVDHPQELWARFFGEQSASMLAFRTGGLEGWIEDEQGKFPIHSLADTQGNISEPHRQVLERLLTDPPFSMPPDKAKGLIMAIKDWVDKDNESTGSLGAEDSYYMSLATPYHCKNGQLATLSELLLIRGMTRELYYGKGGGKSGDKGGGMDSGQGLKDVLTVHGDGLINVNTAGELVLRALVAPSVSLETAALFAQSVIAFRTNPNNIKELSEASWVRSKMVGFKDVALRAEILTTRSNVFSLHMTGVVGGVRKSVVVHLKREKPAQLPMDKLPVTILSRQVF